MSWPGTHPEVKRTLQQLIEEEAGHIRWVKDRLDAYAAANGEKVVNEMMERFKRIDEEVYNGLRQYADRFEQVVGPKHPSADSVEQRLRRVAADSLGHDESDIRFDATLAEMGIDSLDLVVFMMAVEEEFRVEFTREEQTAFRTLRDVALVLKQRTKD